MPLGLESKVVCSSGGAQANDCSFAAVAGFTIYLLGFDITGLGATALLNITITVTGSASSNTPTWSYTVPAGVTVAAPILQVRFGEGGLAASGPNVVMKVAVPSFGAGNTLASCVAFARYV